MKLTDHDLHERVKRIDSIPTIPTIIEPLLSMLQLPTEQVKMKSVEKLVGCDESIAAQCLKMANSPLFGRTRVESVGSAITLLGLKKVQSILLSCSLNRVVPRDKWAVDPVTFWRHSLGCALVTRRLAELIAYPDTEKAYLAGLLHDLGIIVTSMVCTEQFRQCLQQAALTRTPLVDMELESLGFSHCVSGNILAQQWYLPTDLCEVIELHHTVDSNQTIPPLVCLVHLSDLLCRVRNLGYGYQEALCVDFSENAAWNALAQSFPILHTIDLARFTLDMDEWLEEVISVVDGVFAPRQTAERNG
jgi:HD-like signal output (HDOD) protein